MTFAEMLLLLTCDQKFSTGSLIFEWGSVSVDWQISVGHNWALLIDWLSNDVHNSSEGGWTDGDHDGVPSVGHSLSSDESFSWVEGDGPDIIASQMLGDFQNKSITNSLNLKGIENRW